MTGQARQILRFGVVGSVGFMVDGGLLWLLVRSGLDPYLARCLTFPPAVLVTWYLNRIWAFRLTRTDRPLAEARRYFVVQVAGALVNFAVYSMVLAVVGQSPGKALCALAVGSAAGLVVNFCGAKLLVFNASGQGA